MRLAILVAMSLATSPARAAMMPHSDLASLALEAEVIVRAERVDAGRFRVTRILGGAGVAVGDTLSIDLGSYSFETGLWGREPLPLDRTCILFLQHRMDDPARWGLVRSGLRVFSRGRAYRFEQWRNPGNYVPVPQGRDPDDVVTGVETGEHWNLSQLETHIAGAVERASHARRAITTSDRTSIVALLPSPRAAWPRPASDFYEDVIARQAFEALERTGDVEGALEVWARTRGMRPWRTSLDTSALLAQAEAPSVPVHRRVAAVSLVEFVHSDEVVARLFAIARGNAPAIVRATAVERLASAQGTSSMDPTFAGRRARIERDSRALIAELLTREEDAQLRISSMCAAVTWGMNATAALATFIVRDGEAVEWALAALPRAPVIELAAQLRRPDGSTCPIQLERRWSSNPNEGARVTLTSCPGATDVVLSVRDGAPIELAIP